MYQYDIILIHIINDFFKRSAVSGKNTISLLSGWLMLVEG